MQEAFNFFHFMFFLQFSQSRFSKVSNFVEIKGAIGKSFGFKNTNLTVEIYVCVCFK